MTAYSLKQAQKQDTTATRYNKDIFAIVTDTARAYPTSVCAGVHQTSTSDKGYEGVFNFRKFSQHDKTLRKPLYDVYIYFCTPKQLMQQYFAEV